MSIEDKYQPSGAHATVLEWSGLALVVVWVDGEMGTGEQNVQVGGREGGHIYLDSPPR